jgi:translation initiation factor IF-3
MYGTAYGCPFFIYVLHQDDYSYRENSILDLFVSKIEDVCAVEKAAKLEGRNMIMILAPKRA